MISGRLLLMGPIGVGSFGLQNGCTLCQLEKGSRMPQFLHPTKLSLGPTFELHVGGIIQKFLLHGVKSLNNHVLHLLLLPVGNIQCLFVQLALLSECTPDVWGVICRHPLHVKSLVNEDVPVAAAVHQVQGLGCAHQASLQHLVEKTLLQESQLLAVLHQHALSSGVLAGAPQLQWPLLR